VGGDGHHHQFVLRAEGLVDQRVDVERQVGGIDLLAVLDVDLPGEDARRDGFAVDRHVDGHAGEGRDERADPCQAFRRNMLRVDQFFVDVPHGGVGHHALAHDLQPVGQAHTVSFIVFNQHALHQLAVQQLSTVALDGPFIDIG